MGWRLWVGTGRQIAAGNEEVDKMDQEVVVGGYEEKEGSEWWEICVHERMHELYDADI